jgi:hypothetical protein
LRETPPRSSSRLQILHPLQHQPPLLADIRPARFQLRELKILLAHLIVQNGQPFPQLLSPGLKQARLSFDDVTDIGDQICVEFSVRHRRALRQTGAQA